MPDGVIADAAGVSPDGSDGLVMYRQNPLAVVLPRTTEQVSKVLAWCHANGVKVVARGSGTSLSGGALPLADGIVLGMARFNRILSVDYDLFLIPILRCRRSFAFRSRTFAFVLQKNIHTYEFNRK